MSFQEAELEDVLMNNSFYTYDKSTKPASRATVQTNFMKNSPSIKALESILNEKSRSFNYNLNNLSSQSVQSFQTAQESVSDNGTNSSDSNIANGAQNASANSAHSNGYTYLSTPKNDGLRDPRRLETIDASPLSHNDSTVNENDDKIEERTTDNEDTLIDDSSNHHNYPAVGASTNKNGSKYIKMPSMIPPDMKMETKRKSMLLDEGFKKPMSISVSTPNLSHPSPKDITPTSTPRQPPTAKSATPKTNTFGSFDNYQTPTSVGSRPNATPSPRKSPHFRSNSAFNLKATKDDISPGKHKRSSTLTDLSNFDDDKKPKFSFKSLFKKKDKKKEEPKKDTKKDAKKEAKREKKEQKAKETKTKKELPQQQPKQDLHQDQQIQQDQIQAQKAPQHSVPQSQPYTSNIMLPTARPTKTFKSNTNINFIREVTDDFEEPEPQFNDDYDTKNLINNPARKLKGSNQYGEEMSLAPSPLPEMSYPDSQNNYKPSPASEKRYSTLAPTEFTGLAPSALPKSNNPFVNYSNHRDYDDDYDDDDIFGSPNKNHTFDQLVGDSLFPKSLNAQEVESIVSLERSRSMKSVKSSKRTSFVNYDGSDENIVLFNESFNSAGNSPSVSTTRSNSILKNGRNHKHNSIDSQLKTRNSVVSASGNEEDFGDLMEFSDFINFDNDIKGSLDFDVDVADDSIQNVSALENNGTESPKEKPLVLEQYEQPAPNQNKINEDKLEQSPNYSNSRIQPPNYQVSAAAAKRQSTYQDRSAPAAPAASIAPPAAENHTPKSNRMSTYNYSGTNESPILISSSSSIDGDSEEPIQPLKISPRPELTPEITVTQQQFAANNGQKPSYEYKPPVLNTSTKTNASKPANSGSRPISMSFKGLKAPSFGDKLANKSLRSSGSHQSFNISYEDSDFSESAVGDGFGSSDDERDEIDEVDEDHGVHNHYNHTPQSSGRQFTPQSDRRNFTPQSDRLHYTPQDDDYDFSHDEYSDEELDAHENYKENYIPRQTTLPKTLSSLTSTPVSMPARRTTASDGVRFSSRIILYETYNGDEYDRHPDTATCNQLTPALAQMIRDELNDLKGTMPIHEDSRCYTHFF